VAPEGIKGWKLSRILHKVLQYGLITRVIHFRQKFNEIPGP